jgi:hypothetical protein
VRPCTFVIAFARPKLELNQSQSDEDCGDAKNSHSNALMMKLLIIRNVKPRPQRSAKNKFREPKSLMMRIFNKNIIYCFKFKELNCWILLELQSAILLKVFSKWRMVASHLNISLNCQRLISWSLRLICVSNLLD